MTKSQKKKKKNFGGLILLLFLTMVLLATSTYAWFTANQTVTISTITTNVEATGGIQISSNAKDWKTLISNADITAGYTGHVNQLPTTISDVSSDGTVDSTTGHLNMYKDTVGSHSTTGEYTLTTEKQTDAAGATGEYVAFDVFFKLDKAGTVYLTTASGVTFGDTDNGLQNATRVAFDIMGNAAVTTDGSDTPISTFLALNNGSSNTVRIWEPNAKEHTSYAEAAATSYDITLNGSEDTTAQSTTYTPYYGINSEWDTADILMKDLVKGTAGSSYVTAVTPAIITNSDYNTEDYDDVYETAFTLAAGVTKVRIYMWIEGQDIDCENNASGHNVKFDLQFSLDDNVD